VGGEAGNAMTPVIRHLTREELEAGLDAIRQSPRDRGVVELIQRRPAVGEREPLDEGRLDAVEGLVGDTWIRRASKMTPNGSPHPRMQLTVMNARAASLVAVTRDRWALAGDQLFVDLYLILDNLPPGTLLEMGSAIIEVSEVPHTGCDQFVSRFGLDAMKFVNSPVGRRLNLRGINAVVMQGGTVRVGDRITVRRPEV
jgi:hypothetical protein